jgi:hypothetical protein
MTVDAKTGLVSVGKTPGARASRKAEVPVSSHSLIRKYSIF